MKNTFVLYFILFALGCKEKGLPKEKEIINPLGNINNRKTLLLQTRNDRCGEWGGDKESIFIYSNSNQKVYYADYIKEVMQCDRPYSDTSEREMTYKKKIIMEYETKLIAQQCITELAKMKLSNNFFVDHSGSINSAITSDSSIVIIDYPSRKWNSFFALRDSLLSK